MAQALQPPTLNLGAILLQQGKITAVQLSVGLYLQSHSPSYEGCRLGEILIGCGFIREDDLIDALAIQPALLGEVQQVLRQLLMSNSTHE
jgi:hypothetical protein